MEEGNLICESCEAKMTEEPEECLLCERDRLIARIDFLEKEILKFIAILTNQGITSDIVLKARMEMLTALERKDLYR